MKHTLSSARRQNIYKREIPVLDMKTAGAKVERAITFSWYSGRLLAITKNAVPPWLCVTIKIFCCFVCSIMWSIIAGRSYIPISCQLIRTDQLLSKYNDLIFGDKSRWKVIPTISEHPKIWVWSGHVQVLLRESCATHITQPHVESLVC